ncbi:MAG: dihydrolipoamide acetyltransferase family protein [Dongiaceae bacterium]
MGIRVVKLPDIGEGVAEAEVVEWQVKVGDLVAEDQVLASVMTDKATVEIPAPCAGTVTELGAEIGQSLAVGAILVRLDVAGAGNPEPAAKKAAPATSPSAAPATAASTVSAPPVVSEAASLPRAAAAKTIIPPTTSTSAPLGTPRAPGEKPVASPAVRGRALEAGVDLRQVRGTGSAGRIRHEDIDLFLRRGQTGTAVPNLANTSVEEIKVVGLRRRIAQKMAEATRRVAHFAYVEEVDVTALENLRTTLNNQAGGRAKLTLLPLLMQAVVKAVGDFPQMNAHYDDEADIIRRFGGVHIGMATQTPTGLMVPVIRHAEARDLWDLASEVKRLSDAAREGLATRDELSGSTITITSLGALGGIVSTPVMNRPEVAIIGVNKQAIRPVWQDGQFVPRKMMNLSSSFDHRVIDGYDAARFIQCIKGLLEQPATMFIGKSHE